MLGIKFIQNCSPSTVTIGNIILLIEVSYQILCTVILILTDALEMVLQDFFVCIGVDETILSVLYSLMQM